MFKKKFVTASILLALAGGAQAAVPINFDPDGPGPAPTITGVMTFDWLPSSALAVGGNPSGGLVTGNKVTLLTHAKLSLLTDENGNLFAPPAGTEITFVGGFGEIVVIDTNGAASFINDGTNATNFFEIWVSTLDANNLAGTGFNNSKRILYGLVTGSSGGYAGSGPPNQALDQFGNNNYPAITTIIGSGSTQISVNVISADADYFPGFTPALLDSVKLFFNTSTVTPYRQVNPSANFVGDDAGADGLNPPPANVAANIGTVNGGLQTGAALNFELQADANQSFEVGEVIPGACRVTYGGNDRNGNIAQNSFGQACMKVKGGLENCYTFGGQVGAPTANPAFGGPFGEHTHHQVSGPAGDFVFRAGTRSAPDRTRITATACKDPGACRQAEANAGFKQIDFEGTGSFRTLSATAQAYLATNGGGTVLPDHQDTRKYYFRVDMDDTGEPGNKFARGTAGKAAAFLGADLNRPLSDPDPLLASYAACNELADVYQFYICKDENVCEQAQAMYAVRGYLTGGNIQLHKVIK